MTRWHWRDDIYYLSQLLWLFIAIFSCFFFFKELKIAAPNDLMPDELT